MTLQHKLLVRFLRYNPERGKFYWRKTFYNVKANQVAGNINPSGYIEIGVFGKRYLAHRLAWFYVHGKWPQHEIDHINRIRDDNRIANLREATHAENLRNQKLNKRNTSGHRGVCWDAEKRLWLVQVGFHGKTVYGGRFALKADAVARYNKISQKLYGKFSHEHQHTQTVRPTTPHHHRGSQAP